jgi:predicted amidophosphoribosyltransferase
VPEQLTDVWDSETDWNRACPHCGAKIQPVARACWQCGAQINEQDSDHLDYRPPAIDPEEVSGMSISVLLAIGLILPVAFVAWIISLIW